MNVYIYHNSDVDGRISAATMHEFLRGHSKPIDNQESITNIDIIEFPTDRLSYKFDMFDSLIIVLDTMYDYTFLYDLKYEIEEHSNFIWYFTNNISRYKMATSYISTSELKDNFMAVFNPNKSISEIVYTFCMEKIDLTKNWVDTAYGGNMDKAKLDLHSTELLNGNNDYSFKFTLIDETLNKARTFHCLAVNIDTTNITLNQFNGIRDQLKMIFGKTYDRFDYCVCYYFDGTKYRYRFYSFLDNENPSNKFAPTATELAAAFSNDNVCNYDNTGCCTLKKLVISKGCTVRIKHNLFHKYRNRIVVKRG